MAGCINMSDTKLNNYNYTNNCNNNCHNDNDIDDGDDDDDDDELFIVHENIFCEKLLKSCSTNLSEGQTDFVDNDF